MGIANIERRDPNGHEQKLSNYESFTIWYNNNDQVNRTRLRNGEWIDPEGLPEICEIGPWFAKAYETEYQKLIMEELKEKIDLAMKLMLLEEFILTDVINYTVKLIVGEI